jgi:hypothetical protein
MTSQLASAPPRVKAGRATLVPWSVRVVVAVAALAAANVVWAAVPMHGATRGAKPALLVAALCAAASVGQLFARMSSDRPGRQADQAPAYVPGPVELGRRAWGAFVLAPWPQGAIVAVVVLEALHPSRPWHTGLLAVLLIGYLLALHVAETGATASLLRPQLPLLVAGLCLAALAVGSALLPAGNSLWLTGIAAVAAVVAAGLALPV